MATTSCPHCDTEFPVPEDDAAPCPSCGRPLRFIDVPERDCRKCGAAVPVPPGKQAVACPGCGTLQAADPRRGLRFMAQCPRCRRRIDVPAREPAHACPHCGASMRLQDTL